MNYTVYILVFAAVTVSAVVVLRLFRLIGAAKGEDIEASRRRALYNGESMPIELFVSAGRLFQLRLMSALIPGIGVPVVFLLFGLHQPVVLLLMGGVLGCSGFNLPKWYYGSLVAKRQQRFESRILDLTMGLANALKAGMALPQALDRVSAQMGGVMQDELAVVLREYRLGLNIVEALERLQKRMPCEDLQLLSSAIKLTLQSGGSLVEVLSEMVVMIRGRTEFQGKLKTLTAQGRFEAIAMASAPLVAFLLLYLVNPGLMTPLVTTVTGWLAISAAITLEVLGFVCIKKIVTIEV